MTAEPAVRLENFSCTYEAGRPVLADIAFTVAAGERVALLGPNGAGKSTLLRALVGLIAGHGTITVSGRPVIRKNLDFIRQQAGFLFQDPQVQLFCPTVIEDVAFGPLNRHGDRARARQEALAALEQVGFGNDPFTPCHKLSLGEMRKAALAGVLACEPSILLLDEPDSYLDDSGYERLMEILKGLQNATLLVATHDAEFARRVCHREIHLVAGRIDAVADDRS